MALIRQGDAPSPQRALSDPGCDIALHARAASPKIPTGPRSDLLYGALEIMQPSPVVTFEPRSRGLQGAGAEARAVR